MDYSSLGLLFLRVMMGLGIAHHGFQKLFGGHLADFAGGLAKMGFPFPMGFAWLSALTEFLGGVLIVLGLRTRGAAAFVFVNMGVAAFVAHMHDPLKVKELALAYFTIAGALMLTGGGKFSLDRN